MNRLLRVSIASVLVSVTACTKDAPPADSARVAGSATVRAVAEPTSLHWPADPMRGQFGDWNGLVAISQCGTSAVITADSVGPFRPGQALSAVARLCPRA